MHGWDCQPRTKGRHHHMLTAPSRVTASVETDSSSPLARSSSISFCKDGRKISVGDCALFKPPRECPPSIGIIRSVTAKTDNRLKLRVNWLYRPAELSLGKGILLEAAPNEILYSFHEDEIPAESLLHPCKVAFLPRGVELSSGICSFVCWRVYDITNKCLWWLTDQEFMDGRRQEVDQLLSKTRSEMHTTLHQGGHSPKSMNSPTTSQLKPGTDGALSNSSFPSQGKGRKRERIDHSSDSVKRERLGKMDDNASCPLRTESGLRSELAKITEKGGLVDSVGVEKLVQLMLPERNDRKIDLVSRSILAGVIVATDKFDCLSCFVQLKGLPVFDAWLQEVHKGKLGEGSSPKGGDRSVEDFLLILLRALDKLPVNLHALQTCNIGKSVNHLRSHKNSEIQKKARSLVDTWKKRVEAEMDAKSGSNQPGRPRNSEVSHGSGGSADASKVSTTHLHTSKSVSVKLHVENSMKIIAAYPSSMRSVQTPGSGCTTLKDEHLRNSAGGGVADVTLTAENDEKSSGSSQSHNNFQSGSCEHDKTGSFSGKEDARSTTAGSKTANKSSGGSSVALRETVSSRSSSSQRNASSEKLSQSTLTSAKTLEVPEAEGCSNKLIVKLPNCGHSPVQNTCGETSDDPAAVNSRSSSPVISEKRDHFDCNTKENTDTDQANFSTDTKVLSRQNNDSNDIVTGTDKGAGLLSAVSGDEHCMTIDDSKKAVVVKDSSPPSGNELKSGKGNERSFSSMNALVESCVRFSETSASLGGTDDVGMNLLASVAADEMSKPPIVSPLVSPLAISLVVKNNSDVDHTKLIASSLNSLPCEQHLPVTNAAKDDSDENDKHNVSTSTVQLNDSGNVKDSKPGDLDESLNSEIKHSQQLLNQCLKSNENSNVASSPLPTADDREKVSKDNEWEVVDDRKTDVISDVDHISDTTRGIGGSMLIGYKANDINKNSDSLAVEQTLSEIANDCKKEKLRLNLLTSESVKTMGDKNTSITSGFGKCMTATNTDSLMTEKKDDKEVNHKHQSDEPENKLECDASLAIVVKQVAAGLDSAVANSIAEHVEENIESTDLPGRRSLLITPSAVSMNGAEEHRGQNVSRPSTSDGNEAEEGTSKDASSVSCSAGSEIGSRVEFDLNEGFDGDDARIGDANDINGSVCLNQTPSKPANALVFPLPLISTGRSASVTVAAAVKGPFVPPVNLLRNKGTTGWKGSAATSAFRPAERRRVLDAPSASAGKQTRMMLDIDLNVPDERLLEDLAPQIPAPAPAPAYSSRGLDLDLNKFDDPSDMNNYTMSIGNRLDVTLQQAKLPSGSRLEFDLNDGPAADDVNYESSRMFSQHYGNSFPPHLTLSGIQGNIANPAATNAYSAVTIPPVLPERGDQAFSVIANGGPHRVMGPTTDVYRGGPLLLSSPPVPFHSTGLQYPVLFPSGSSFTSGGSTAYMDSSSSSGRLGFSALPVPSNYPRPYLANNGMNSGIVDNNGKWLRPGLDLNTGPGGGHETRGGRDGTSSRVQRQSSSSNNSASLKQEQARMYEVPGNALKRKEPDVYKQQSSSWQ